MRFELFKILLFEKALLRFMLGVVLSFGFSMAVILSTLGLMDGFDFSMKKFMRRSTGDILMYSQNGFFNLSHKTRETFRNLNIDNYAEWIKTEGFVISKKGSKGIVIRGVDQKSFFKVTDLDIPAEKGEIIIGDELAKVLGVSVGDPIVLAFASGNESLSNLSLLKSFRLKKIIHQGLYREDMRFVYLNLDELRSILKLGKRSNIISINIPKNENMTFEDQPGKYSKLVVNYQERLREKVGVGYRVWPFWKQFQTLFEAVKVQKIMIGIILQLIVVTSIFNILAFIIYINNQKSKEIFLLSALGMSRNSIRNLWWNILRVMWGLSCVIAMAMVNLFGILLAKLPFLEMPGQIYYMSRFALKIGYTEYLLIFILSYIWLKVIFYFTFKRTSKSSTLVGLKKEFI